MSWVQLRATLYVLLTCLGFSEGLSSHSTPLISFARPEGMNREEEVDRSPGSACGPRASAISISRGWMRRAESHTFPDFPSQNPHYHKIRGDLLAR